MNGKNKKMNSELQKKWFVYLSDHHEGPYSVIELKQKHKEGIMTAQSYVWCEGMTDWKPLSETQELNQEMLNSNKATSISPIEEKKILPTPKMTTKTPLKKFRVAISVVAAFVFFSSLISFISFFGGEDLHASIRPTLIKIVNRTPLLSFMFSLTPNIQEIGKENKKTLEDALLGLPENNVKMAFSLAQTDPNRPYFFVATNLPNQTKLDIYVIANGDTILNRLQFRTQITATVNKGIAKSEVLIADNGQPISKGEYQVWVTESQDQEDSVKQALSILNTNRATGDLPSPIPNSAKFVMNKTVFIGGARDEAYLTRLKAFHEKIKVNSEKELLELKQYADTLMLQHQTLTSEFEKILKTKKMSEAQKNNWKKTSAKWTEINSQLDQTIQTWTPETLQNEFFYGSAYELVKGAYDSIKNLFTIENNYIDNPVERSLFEIQHGKAMSESRQMLDLLRGKIEAILKAPKSPNGLPKRDTL